MYNYSMYREGMNFKIIFESTGVKINYILIKYPYNILEPWNNLHRFAMSQTIIYESFQKNTLYPTVMRAYLSLQRTRQGTFFTGKRAIR